MEIVEVSSYTEYEKYEIAKDEKGEYISDNMYSIKIYISVKLLYFYV